MKFRFLASLLIVVSAHADTYKEDAAHAAEIRKSNGAKVLNERLNVQWGENDAKLWFKLRLEGGKHEHVVIDTATGARETVSDASKLPDAAQPPKKEKKKRRPDHHKVPSPVSNSPDGKQELEFREHNLVLKSGDEEATVTTDGKKTHPSPARGYWSPDSKFVAVLRPREAQKHPVTMIATRVENTMYSSSVSGGSKNVVPTR